MESEGQMGATTAFASAVRATGWVGVACALALGAHAGTDSDAGAGTGTGPGAGPAAGTASPAVPPGDPLPTKLLAVTELDLNGDGLMDRARLMQREPTGEVDFLLDLGGESGGFYPNLWASNIAWSGEMAGTLPSLDITARGSLQVISENASIGRYRWRKVLTLAWRDHELLLAGYTYESRDTLDLDAPDEDCDINLLTGRGVVAGVEIRIPPRRMSLLQYVDAPAGGPDVDLCKP